VNKITSFRGEHRFLSNFYVSPFVFKSIQFKTVEHAYQAYKTDNIIEFNKMIALNTAFESKKEGKKLKLRSDWEEIKYPLMRKLVYKKFIQNPEIKEKLILTGNIILEEGNSWGDTYWGVCPEASTNGQNNLGVILMEIRSILRSS
jgi:ribA/ribD-fused uncharacterized protein